jgi:hypothetical protein
MNMPLKSPAIANSRFRPRGSEAEGNLDQRRSKQKQAASMKNPGSATPILELMKFPKTGLPKATQAEAKAMDKEVIRIVGQIRSNWLQLGSLIQRMIDSYAFEALGLGMHAWMTARFGNNLSSAYSALKSVRALHGIPQEKLQQIGERNAHALTRLPERLRKSNEWIEKAATFPTKEFKQEVQIALEQKTGLRTERFKTFSIALPEAVYEAMLEVEKKVARALVIDIESTPGNRILVWEALSQSILQTDENMLKVQIEGT